MFNVRLAGCHLYGKQLFTWLSLVVSFMASFMLSFFPLDVLDGIWDLIESVSEGFLTHSLVATGPAVLAVGMRGSLDVFSFIYHFFFFVPLFETVWYTLKYFLKGPKTTNQMSFPVTGWFFFFW